MHILIFLKKPFIHSKRMNDIVANTGISYDDLIVVKARAHNLNGWGGYA